ncbi:hypothetical protein ACA910_014402 [Epithemia clementina (nom. ined.)]
MTLDGRALPLQVLDGLSYLKTLGTPSDSDMEKYPHIIFTAPGIWDLSILDHEHPDICADIQPEWAHVDQDGSFTDDPYDWHGEYTERVVQNLNVLLDLPPDAGEYTPHYPDAPPASTSMQQLFFHHNTTTEVDWSTYRPFFGWAPAETIAETFKHTTQHGNFGDGHDYLKKHFKARNPVLNIPRRYELFATDTIFLDTPAINHGGKLVQVFVGRNTTVSDAYGIKSTKQFVNTLQDNICQCGAMESLISNGGAALILQKVKDILRTLLIADYQSEPYHQHQNYAENWFATMKHWVNTIMNLTGWPAFCWLLCLQYVCVLLNHVSVGVKRTTERIKEKNTGELRIKVPQIPVKYSPRH